MSDAITTTTATAGRDLGPALLEAVGQHRAMTTAQLAALYGLARRTVQKTLCRLRHRELLDRVAMAPPRFAHVWFPTIEGMRQLSAVRPDLARRRPPGPPGPLVHHTLAVNEVGVAFVTAARAHGHDCGPLDWHHEIAHSLGDARQPRGRGRLVADALLHYGLVDDAGRRHLLYRFIELDRASMSVQALAAKLRTYAAFSRERRWAAAYPIVPAVIVVCSGAPADVLARRVRAVTDLWLADPVLRKATSPGLTFTTLEQLITDGPFAPIFSDPNDPGRAVDFLGRIEVDP